MRTRTKVLVFSFGGILAAALLFLSLLLVLQPTEPSTAPSIKLTILSWTNLPSPPRVPAQVDPLQRKVWMTPLSPFVTNDLELEILNRGDQQVNVRDISIRLRPGDLTARAAPPPFPQQLLSGRPGVLDPGEHRVVRIRRIDLRSRDAPLRLYGTCVASRTGLKQAVKELLRRLSSAIFPQRTAPQPVRAYMFSSAPIEVHEPVP